MLSEGERRDLQAEIAHAYNRRAAFIPCLKVIQNHRGWVSDQALAELAEFVGATPAELDSLATFYSLIFRRPVGRHVIKVCDSVSCWIMGAESVFEHLRHKLGIEPGGTTADGRFTLLPICCLGECDHAPAMMVNDLMVRDLTPQRIDELLDSLE